MPVSQIKAEVARLPITQQDELASYLSHLKRLRDPKQRRETTQRNSRRRAGDWMAASQDRVYPAAAEWQFVLQQDLDVAQARLHEIVGQHRNAAVPGASLRRRRPRSRTVQDLCEHELSHTAAASERGQTGGRAPN